MSHDRALVAKLKVFLAELPPDTRASLVRMIDKARLQGRQDAVGDLVLQAARLHAWESGEPLPRVASPMRRFFDPLAPFLIGEMTSRKQKGRIARASLTPIWTFLTRDVLPERMRELMQAVLDAALADDEDEAARLTAQSIDEAVPALARLVANTADSLEWHRRLVGILGGERALEDLDDAVRIYRLRHDISGLLARAPATVVNLNADLVPILISILADFAQGDRERLLYGLAALQHRFADPLQILTLAVAAAGTDDPARLESSGYGAAVDLALTEVDRTVQRLAHALSTRSDPARVLKRFHAMTRSFATALDLSGASGWQQRLSELRSLASQLISAEVERAPGLIRRALNPVDPSTRQVSPFDAVEAEHAVFAARLYTAARHSSDALAINDLLARLKAPIERGLESASESLPALARSGDAALAEDARQRMPFAVEVATALFGEDYAAILRRNFATSSQDVKAS